MMTEYEKKLRAIAAAPEDWHPRKDGLTTAEVSVWQTARALSEAEDDLEDRLGRMEPVRPADVNRLKALELVLENFIALELERHALATA